MRYKVIALIIAMVTNGVNSRSLSSGDIVGRELLIPGLGWVGHVGIGTGDSVGSITYLIIETLNENPVIQINFLDNFKSRSKYWGSKYGIGDYGNGTRAVLVEANHQRWWCPSYTDSTAYTIGQGNPNTGQVSKCGVWRCDTMVAWSFYSAGYNQLMNNIIMLPVNIFKTFPYYNNSLSSLASDPLPPLLVQSDKEFADLSADELNTMPYEQFERIADIPLDQVTPTHAETEWRFANDQNVNDIKRGIFIDRLSMSNEQDIISRFLKMYDETKNPKIKAKLIQGTMIYYQKHQEAVKLSLDNELLKTFYSRLLNKLTPINVSMALRGYIDFHSSKEILENTKKISKQFEALDAHSLLGLELELVHKSKKLEEIYFPLIISMLKNANSSDLDDMFFGLMQIGYKHLHNKESTNQIKDYMQVISTKYLSSPLSNNNDPYLEIAKSSFINLRSKL